MSSRKHYRGKVVSGARVILGCAIAVGGSGLLVGCGGPFAVKPPLPPDHGLTIIGRYYLPRAELRVKIPVFRVTFVAGQFDSYSRRYSLPTYRQNGIFQGTTCPSDSLQKRERFVLGEADITASARFDPREAYLIAVEGHIDTQTEALVSEVVRPGIIGSELILSEWHQRVDPPQSTLGEGDAARLRIRGALDSLPGEAANATINRLREIQSMRDTVIGSGTAGTDAIGNKGTSLLELDREEQMMASRFMGSIRVEEETIDGYFVPSSLSERNVEWPLLRFSACAGVEALAGNLKVPPWSHVTVSSWTSAMKETYKLVIAVDEASSAFADASAEALQLPLDKQGLKYRVPLTGVVTITSASAAILTANVVFPQLGPTIAMQRKVRLDDDGRPLFVLDPATGEVKRNSPR